MKINPVPMPIYSIKNRKRKINPKPQYQRGPVWSEEKNQQLIDTILRGYDMPKFYLRATTGDYEHEVVDGQQRLRAIWGFCDNEYPLGIFSADLPDGDLSGKKFNELTSDQQDIILGFVLTMTEITDATENEIRELFLRLQEGVSLNPAEKRNAMLGNMRDFIAKLANHQVFLRTRFSNSRFAYDDIAAHITCIELAGGPTDVKAADLKKMYEDNKRFESNGTVAKRINRVLNYMAFVLHDSPPEMNIKWGFVDLYLLISMVIDEYDISGRHQDFNDFYVSFERARNEVKDPADLITGSTSEWSRDMYDYIEAFQREGAKRINIEARHKVYLNRFLRDFPDIVPKDSTRLFNNTERIIIWRRAGKKCEDPDCDQEVAFNEMHADHVVPHSKGGKTVINNGQCLCSACNLKKSNIQ